MSDGVIDPLVGPSTDVADISVWRCGDVMFDKKESNIERYLKEKMDVSKLHLCATLSHTADLVI